MFASSGNSQSMCSTCISTLPMTTSSQLKGDTNFFFDFNTHYKAYPPDTLSFLEVTSVQHAPHLQILWPQP